MDQPRMGGEIEAGLLADLLQLLSTRGQATGFLEVAAAGIIGRIWFQNGRMIDAQWGITCGESAVQDMLAIQNGRFRFVESQSDREPTIRRDTTCVLLDGMRALDEQEPQTLTAPPVEPAPSPAPPRPAEPPPTETREPVSKRSPRRTRTAGRRAIKPKHRCTKPRARTTQRPMHQLALAVILLAAFSISMVWFDNVNGDHMGSHPLITADVSTPTPTQNQTPPPLPKPIPELWPRFSLSGLLASGRQNGEGAAVVNGEVVSVGESVDGMVIREIGDEGVTLEFRGTRKFQSMTEDHKRSVNRPTQFKIYLNTLRDFSFLRNS